MSDRKYTAEEVRRWLEMYNDGKTIEEISLEVGFSYATVAKRFRELPDYKPRPKGPPKGYSRNDSRVPASPSSKAVKKVVLGKSHLGHRRRGGLR